jgi:hypothetical protein
MEYNRVTILLIIQNGELWVSGACFSAEPAGIIDLGIGAGFLRYLHSFWLIAKD